MKVKDFMLRRSKKSIEVIKGTVNNKTAPTSETIIQNLSQVLLDIYQKAKVEGFEVNADE